MFNYQVDVLSSYNEMITCMGTGGMFGNFTGVSKQTYNLRIGRYNRRSVLVSK